MKELHADMIAHLGPNTSWTLDPLQIVPTVIVAALYTRRVLTLRDRGTPVPGWRIALFATGILTLLVAFVSPVHALGERMFSFHMLQHVLLGDLAPLALLAGLTGPILRPVLAYLYRLRFLANPLVALPLWAVNLYLWHLPFLYDAAVRNDWVHALEHFCFFTGGLIMWLPVLETLPAPEWFGTGAKLGYIAVVRIVETILGNVFFWAGSTFYVVYEHQNRLWGLSALADQGLAGAVMMIEGSIVTLVALAWLFLRLASEGEVRQELLERGLDPRAVRRAVRYGRAEELSRSR
jgi:putative membrane protein